jgi:uncharacterized membrane protein (DUF2068 family)
MKSQIASTETKLFKKRAPTLYLIIAMKLLKGALFAALAIYLYALSDNDLPAEYQKWLHLLRFNPERKFWSDLATQIGGLTEAKVLWAAVGTLIYSLFAWVEAIGMIFRVSWAGWLAIGESAFFIPIEIFELTRRRQPGEAPVHPYHSWIVLAVLVANIFIVWYLFQNRGRLFRHHHSSHAKSTDENLGSGLAKD